MAESQELQQLKRLLRAGFNVDRIRAQAGRNDSDPDSGFEITTTSTGSKAQFTYRNDAVSQTEPDGPLEVTFPHREIAVNVNLTKNSSARTVTSASEDFRNFVLAMHPSLDVKGNVVLRRFADNNRYWKESEWLATVTLDAKNRLQQLLQSGTKVDNKLKTLLLEFLKTRDWGAARFLPLKQQFFELQSVLLYETQRFLSIQQKTYANNPKAKPYGDLVEELLNALWQQDDSFTKRCIRFLSLVRFDIDDAIIRASEQRKHVDDLLGMLAKRTPMPGRQALPHLLDAYRRYCESLRPFVDVLSEAVCAVEHLPPISPNTGYKKRVALIKGTRFAGIVDCLDPDIRHSESHHGTVIDDPGGRVLLTEASNDGKRRTLGEYTYWQISDMTLDLQNGLFLAVLTAFALHETGLLVTTLVSPEYVHALLSIDNLAE